MRKYLCLVEVMIERNKEKNENEKQRILIFSKGMKSKKKNLQIYGHCPN